MDIQQLLFKHTDNIYNDNFKLIGVIALVIIIFFAVIVYTVVNMIL